MLPEAWEMHVTEWNLGVGERQPRSVCHSAAIVACISDSYGGRGR